MFSGLHVAWLAICVFITGGLLLLSLLKKWSYKTALYVVAGCAAVSELVKVFSRIIVYPAGGFIDITALPLHLCSMLIFVIWGLVFTKNEKLKGVLLSFFVPVALAGGLCAVLIPDEGVSFASIKVWQGFIYHSCIIWFALYLIITKQVDLKLKAYLRNLNILLVLVVTVIWLNGALQIYVHEGLGDVNYFFLVHPPVDGLPVLNLYHGYGAYLATVLALGFFAVTVVHIGPVIKQLKALKKDKSEKS